jgi:hypothetical protein
VGNTVNFLRELDARNAPVQFDEREEETEPRQTGLRRPGENLTNCHREANVTAPLLDSTQLPQPVQLGQQSPDEDNHEHDQHHP